MKFLDRLWALVNELAFDSRPSHPEARGLDECAPGVDAAAAARLRQWLDAPQDPRGPQRPAPFDIDLEDRGAEGSVIRVVPNA
jgi:hypothetical protein